MSNGDAAQGAHSEKTPAIRSEVFLLGLLGALTALSPLAIDIALPGFADMEQDLGLESGAAAATLSLFLLGFAFGPLLFGPISDSIGRRPMLICAMGVFVLTSIACAMATSFETLLSARLLQGIAAGTAASLPIAIVRDLLDGLPARRALSIITMLLGVAPIIAPMIGAGVLLFSAWRSLFLALGLLGAAMFAAIWLGFSESHIAEKRTRLSFTEVCKNYVSALRQPIFLGYLGVNAFNFANMFGFVASSPRVFVDELGVSASLYGLIFGVSAAGVILGATANTQLLKANMSHHRIMMIGLVASCAAALMILLLTQTGTASVITLVPMLMLNTFAAGLIRPNATHEAMQPMEKLAGAASALLRGAQMFMGAVASAGVAALHAYVAMDVMGWMMAGPALISLLIYLVLAAHEKDKAQS